MVQKFWTLALTLALGFSAAYAAQAAETSAQKATEKKPNEKTRDEKKDGGSVTKEQDEMDKETDKLAELTCSRTVNPSSENNVYTTGPLLPNDIIQALPSKMRAAQSCYETAFKKDPQLSGVLKMEVTIAAAGKIETVCFVGDSSLVDLSVWECVKASVMTWSFPSKSGGKTTATIPFKFRVDQPVKGK